MANLFWDSEEQVCHGARDFIRTIAVLKVLEPTQNQFARDYKYNKQCGLIDFVLSFGLHANSDC